MAKAQSIAGGALSGAGTGAAIGTAVGNPIVGVGAGALAGGLMAALSGDGSDEQEKASAIQQQILAEINAIPEPQLKAITLEKYKNAGILAPETENAILQQGDTQYSGIKTNPRYNEQQMAALEDLSNRGRVGLSLSDRAALADIQEKAARQQQADLQSILQNRQMRGVGGGGDELAAALQASQGAANEAARAQRQQAAQAQQAAMSAMAQAGNLAGQLRSQEYGEQEKLAAARDELNRFNTRSRQDVNARNVANRNAAQQFNLTNAQNIANMNTGVSNQQTMYNEATLPQQMYSNALSKHGYTAPAMQSLANMYSNQAAAQAQNTVNLLGGAAQAGLGVAGLVQKNNAMEQDKKFQNSLLDMMRSRNEAQSITPISSMTLPASTASDNKGT